MAVNIKVMTEGKPLKLIFSFALPLMIGNVFQQLYTVVDTMVVGAGAGGRRPGGSGGCGLAELDDARCDTGIFAGIFHFDGPGVWCRES